MTEKGKWVTGLVVAMVCFFGMENSSFACKSTGSFCIWDTDCCSGWCDWNTCKDGCIANGDTCVWDDECCSGWCEWYSCFHSCVELKCNGGDSWCINSDGDYDHVDNDCKCGCSGGTCNSCPTCSDKCSFPGIQDCIDSWTIQTCDDYNNDSCLEWGGKQSCTCCNDVCCDSDEVCKNSSCVVKVDSCASKKCKSGDVWCYDSNGVADHVYEYCDSNEECQNGSCVVKVDSCASKKCKSGDVWCYDSNGDADHVYEYCDSDEVCQNGSCVVEVDSCASKKCKSGDVWCYDSNGDADHVYDSCDGDVTSTTWKCDGSKAVYVETNKDVYCSNAVCQTSTSESVLQTKNCDCGCSNGSCISPCSPVCTNECSSGSKGCSGSQKWSCAKVGDCYEKQYTPCDCGCSSGSCLECPTECAKYNEGCWENDDCCSGWCNYTWDGFFCDCPEEMPNECGGDCWADCSSDEEFNCANGVASCVQKSCLPAKAKTACVGDKLVWLNGCGKQSSVIEDCAGMEPICNENSDGVYSQGFCSVTNKTCYYAKITYCDPDEKCEVAACVCKNDCLPFPEYSCLDGKTSMQCVQSGDCFFAEITPCDTLFGGCNLLDGKCFPPCTNECASGEKGCGGDVTSWKCAKVGNCYKKQYTACSADKICKDAVCVNPCLPATSKKACVGDKLVWLDNCGKQSSVIEDCTVMKPICNDKNDGIWSKGFCSTQDLKCYYATNTPCEYGCAAAVCQPKPCDNECEAIGQTGCEGSGKKWLCVKDGECNKKQFTACGVNEYCDGGVCKVQKCNLIGVNWSTEKPVIEGDKVQIIVSTKGACEGKMIKIRIFEKDIIFPDELIIEFDTVGTADNKITIEWQATYFAIDWSNFENSDWWPNFKLLDYIAGFFNEMTAELYAEVEFVGGDYTIESEDLTVFPPKIETLKVVDLLMSEPIQDLIECQNYGLDEINANCLTLWQSFGIFPIEETIEWISEDEEAKKWVPIILCKGAEYGGCIGLVYCLPSVGVGCVIAVISMAGGFVCDVFYLPDESILVDVAMPIQPVCGLAFAVKSVRKVKMFNAVEKAASKFADEGWKIIKKGYSEVSGFLKVEKGNEKKWVIYTFKKGEAQADKFFYSVVKQIADYPGGMDYMKFSEKWGVDLVAYNKLTDSELKAVAAWFKNGVFQESYEDTLAIAVKMDVVLPVKNIAVDKTVFGASDPLVIKLNPFPSSVPGFEVEEIMPRRVLPHEQIHQIFHLVAEKTGYSKTAEVSLKLINGDVVIIKNSALEFFVDTIYSKHGKLNLAAMYDVIGAEKMKVIFATNKFDFFENFKLASYKNDPWSDPQILDLVRYHAEASANSLDPEFKNLLKEMEEGLAASFAPGTAPELKAEAVTLLKKMSAELLADAGYIADNLDKVGKEDAVTQKFIDLVVNKYRIYEAGSGTINTMTPIPDAVIDETKSCLPNYYLGCVGNEILSFDSCGRFDSVVTICAADETCVGNQCVQESAPVVETIYADKEQYLVESDGCKTYISWFVHNADITEVVDCTISYDDGTKEKCSVNSRAQGIIRINGEHTYSQSGRYAIVTLISFVSGEKLMVGEFADIVCGEQASADVSSDTNVFTADEVYGGGVIYNEGPLGCSASFDGSRIWEKLLISFISGMIVVYLWNRFNKKRKEKSV